MSAGEVLYRVRRMAGQRMEQIRLAVGWTPGRASRLFAHRPLFGSGTSKGISVRKEWLRLFEIDRQGLEGLLAGALPIFGQTFEIGTDVDWHRDPKTGKCAPLTYGLAIDYRQPEIVGDIKVLWEVSRHQHLVPLAVAYAVTGESQYRDAAAAQIDSWIEANPYGRGVHWGSAMEVALRGVAWCMVHSLLALRDEDGLLAVVRRPEALARCIYQHGFFIERNLSRFSSANNHLIGELVGLLSLGSVFDFGAASERWQARAIVELESEIRLQVWSDGVAREQAVQYQLELLDYFAFAGCVAARSGRRLSLRVPERLASMLTFLQKLRPEGGSLPQIGDSDEGVVNRFDPSALQAPVDEIISMVEHLLTARDGSPPPSERAFWYRQIGSLVSDEEANQLRSELVCTGAGPFTLFPDGGYAVLRVGNLQVVFDAGPLGFLSIAAHGHADALAFCAAWRGEWWLVDPGTFAYHGDPVHRSYFRGTAAHNTATVNGADQSVQGGAFMWLTHAAAQISGSGALPAGLWVEGFHEGFQTLGVIHRRKLDVESPGSIRISDRFELSPGASRRIDVFFHFHPEVALDLSTAVAMATRSGCPDTLRIDLDDGWAWDCFRGSREPLAGWYSSALGHKEPCWTLRGTRFASGDSAATTRMQYLPPETTLP